MPTSQQLSQLLQSFARLGPNRLAALGLVGLFVMAAVGFAAYYLGRPAMQPIYTGLNAQDVASISSALSEAGVSFDVNEQRSAVLVPFGQTLRARTLLAQRGLPASSRAGYELFDQMGSIGLTSFMQEITRVRALEGEIARTIQALDGVTAARVHLVLQDPGSFRRDKRDPSGSVLLRLDERWQPSSAQAVRYIVAAAVPGMKTEQVSITSTDGRVLAAGGDERNLGNLKLAEMERSMASELEERANRTLATALGQGNFQVSVTVRLDVDRQQTRETVYDPKSRVERSVKIVKQSGSSEDGSAKTSVGAEANLPSTDPGQTDGDKRRQREDRREELVNYELNTKTVQTEREGYRMQALAIATVVNHKHLIRQLGEKATSEDIAKRLEELKRLIAAATGARLVSSGGEAVDRIEISAVDFPNDGRSIEPVSGPGVMDYLMMNLGTGINALAMLAIVFIVVWLGMRPVTRLVAQQQALEPAASKSAQIESQQGLGLPAPENGSNVETASSHLKPAKPSRGHHADEIRDRLTAIVEANDEQVARVMKAWMEEAVEA